MPTLYVTDQAARLELDAGQLVCTRDDEVIVAVPAARVDRVVLVGGCRLTTPVLPYLLDHGIDLIFVTATGKVRGRLAASRSGVADYRLRQAQYARADDPAATLVLARDFLRGKIHNARTRCMELDTIDDAADRLVIDRLREHLAALEAASSIPEAKGIEGTASRAYFGLLRRHLDPPWVFPMRRRRPPPDPVNAVLSIAYTLLQEQCRAALELTGLDPTCGFLHRPQGNRPSLALDLMEEFRPVIADSVTWTLFNRKMLHASDFGVPDAVGWVILQPEGWRQVVSVYTQRMDTRIAVPGRATRTTYRKLLEIQAWQIRRIVEGTLACYEPFRSR